MSDLIIAAYRSPNSAFVAGESLAALQQEAGVEPEDIVVVTRGAAGRVTVNQSIDLATGQPLGGGRWGALIGMLFLDGRKPTGRGTGLAEQLHAAGLDATFLQDVSRSLGKNGAAVGLHVRMLGVDRVQSHLEALAGSPKILRARLDGATEAALEDLQGQIPASTLVEPDGLI
ncbi:MAG TPA: DUF1269 domain-containing protein [Tabrizicola sp.]|nr:DUF1269 domain-containing protein [Tabrizicola sp.]